MASVSAPSGTDWSGEPLGRNLQRQTPDQMANKMLAEKRDLNSRTRLSWDPNKVPIRGEGKFVGQVCLSLPYVQVDRKYFIQNCRLFKSNGEEISKEALFQLEGGGAIYLRVMEALDNHLKQAVDHDPQLCRHCMLYRFDTTDGMMQHVVEAHPDVLAGMMGIDTTTKPEAKAVNAEQEFWCQSCDRTFQNAGGLRLHRIKKHNLAA